MKTQFLEMLEQHQKLIHRICRIYRDSPEDREDLFQEIVYQLWKSFPKFENRAKVSTWIYRVGLNTAIASFRKPQLPVAGNLESIKPQAAERQNQEEEQMEAMFIAIRKLPDGDKALVSLYLEDLPYREIACITGISENLVGVRLNRIKEKIRKLIKQ
jgi:RNA polymerase sigma-70 factor (ECF subfamily)